MNDQHRAHNDHETQNYLLQWQSPLAAWIDEYERDVGETIHLYNTHCTELSISSCTTNRIQLSFSHPHPVSLYISCRELRHLVCTSGNPLHIYLSTGQPSQLIIEGAIAGFAVVMHTSELEYDDVDHDEPLEQTDERFRFNSYDVLTSTQAPKLWKRVYIVDFDHLPPDDHLSYDDLILCDGSTLSSTCVHIATRAFLVMHSAALADISTQAPRLESSAGIVLMANTELSFFEVNCPHLTLVNCHLLSSISAIDQGLCQLPTYQLESIYLVECSTKHLDLTLATASLILKDCDIHKLSYKRAVNVQFNHCAPRQSIRCNGNQVYDDIRSLFASNLPAEINRLTSLGYEYIRSVAGCVNEHIDAMSNSDNPLIKANKHNPVSIIAMLFVQSSICPKARWRARTTMYEYVLGGPSGMQLPWFWSSSLLNNKRSTNKCELQTIFACNASTSPTHAANDTAEVISHDTMHTLHVIDFILWANAYTAGCPQASDYRGSIARGLRLHQHGFYGLRLLAHVLEHFPEVLSADNWRELVHSAASAVNWMTKPSPVHDENALLVLLHQYMRMLECHLDADASLNPYYAAPVFDLLIHEIYHTHLPYQRLAKALLQVNPTLFEQIDSEFRCNHDDFCSLPEIHTLD